MTIAPAFILDGNGRATPTISPGCEWITDWTAAATQKVDGIGIKIDGNTIWQRSNSQWQEIPATEDRLAQALQRHKDVSGTAPSDGTYELIGPGINGNREMAVSYALVSHRDTRLANFPTDLPSIRTAMASLNIEGVVWHHIDGRMAQITMAQLGMARPNRA